MSEPTKEELTEQMNLKNRELLSKPDGLASLFIFNLENFSYRYLETSLVKGIKCQLDANRFWVESVEPNIALALKWTNPKLKSLLINLCKKYPGSQSKEIKIKMLLETRTIDDHKIECSARLLWQLPSGSEEVGVEKTVEFSFDDPIELRNKHANLLEEVCQIF
jgi:hypothetical protein